MFICTLITIFRYPCTSEDNLEETDQELCIQLADSQQKVDQKEDNLNETSKSIGVKENSLSVSIATLTDVSLIHVH